MKKLLYFAGIVLVACIGYGIYFIDTALPIGNGYAAKYLCSQAFLAGRNPDTIFDDEVRPTNLLFALVKPEVNTHEKSVTARGFGFRKPLTAVYREGYGCTLAVGVSPDDLRRQVPLPSRKRHDPRIPWPRGERVNSVSVPPEVNLTALNDALEWAFREPGPATKRNTRAVVVVYRGAIIAERYAKGISPERPMIGWSMTKTVTAALVGILTGKGKLDILKPAPVPQWGLPGDPRGAITLDQLLRMSSGLDFVEIYGPHKDVTEMLYGNASMADYAAAKKLRSSPDHEWSYSSGTANIVARIVRDATGGTLEGVEAFARSALFDRIGMHSAVIEPDASGSLVGSSYMFATPRDWARFGLLLLWDGMWFGERILPAGWVRYMTTPTPMAPLGEYGAHIWLNAGSDEDPGKRKYPSLPRELFYLSGFNGQVVAVIPSKHLVIVRLGVTHDDSWDQEGFLRRVLEAIGQ
ncbi:MAG: serine hydrolase [Spirochaetes bacterium]|nr:serine hydrolase [Spirochaetota bacterium]